MKTIHSMMFLKIRHLLQRMVMYSHGATIQKVQFGKTTTQSSSYAPVRVDIPNDEVINHISAEKNSNLATTS